MSDDKLSEISLDVKDIKKDVGFLREQSAIHNFILDQHHKRSTQLEDRMIPVEDHVKLVDTLSKIFVACGGIGLLIWLGQHFSGWKL